MFSYKRWLHLLVIALILLAAFGGRQPTVLAAGVFYVTTTVDLNTAPPACDGIQPPQFGQGIPCSLRQAIQKANATSSDANPVTIKFNIKPGGPGYDNSDLTAVTWTITPTLALPAIQASSITLDGNSQAEFIGGQPNQSGPEIIIDGSKIGTVAGGLTIFKQASNCVIKGLGIIKFGGGIAGVQIDGSNNSILGNYIGIDKYGKNPAPNSGPGVWVTTSGEGNIIGGNSSSADEFNTISGNNSDGVFIQGNNNSVRGNLIGTDRFGSTAVPNQRNGVYIFSNANGNTIGTDSAATDAKFRNLISGNGRYGIYVDSASNNGIYGNYIGIDSSTLTRIPNGTATTAPVGTYGGIQIGASIAAATNNIVGGPGTAARNVIAGNIGPGINIFGAEASSNTVVNNYIGISFNGAVPSGGATSHTVGILLNQGANGNTIGGGAGAGNIISGNGGDGIQVLGDIDPTVNGNTDGNTILGNYIGTNVTGLGPLPNLGSGIVVGTFADFTTIGGATDAERNLVAYNLANGIFIRPNNPGDPPIYTTTLNLNTVLRNVGNGVQIDRARYTTLNGTDIRRNGGTGLLATSVYTTTMLGGAVWENAGSGIGVDGGRYTIALPASVLNNGAVGIVLTDSIVSRVGGLNASALAAITGNGSHAVQVTGGVSTTVQYINTNPTNLDNTPLAQNGGDGVNAIGDPEDGQPERLAVIGSNIDKNLGAGVNVSDAELVRVEGIARPGGAEPTRTSVFSNAFEGIIFSNVFSGTVQFQDILYNKADGVLVQGDTEDVSIFRNTIRYNGPQNVEGGSIDTSCSPDGTAQRAAEGQGVSIQFPAKRVRIIRSLFGQNCGLGILRNPNGSDPATTANEGVQPPIITSLNQNGELTGKLPVTCPAATKNCAGWIVELFKSDLAGKPDGEGNTKLNTPTDQIKTFDAQGRFSFALTGGVPLQLLATATDPRGNTSEFGVYTITRSILIAPPRTTLNAIPTQVITYAHTVTNTGTVDDIFRLSYVSEKGFGSDNVKLQPSGNFAVAAGKSVPVTVTLILPKGTDPRVRAGSIERTRIIVSSFTEPSVTASVTDTTTITKSAAITITPISQTQYTQAGVTTTFGHQLTNNGNITATVNLTVTTNPAWSNTLTPLTVTLAPGQTRSVLLDVTPPNGVSAGATATSIIQITVPEYPSQNKVVTDTTIVIVSSRALIYPNRAGDGAAGQLATYLHTVENRSNGSVKFKLIATSSIGSKVTFESVTPGITLDSQNAFTLGTASGTNLLNFNAKVLIPTNAILDSVDIVTINLVDATTNEVLGTVQDRTTITRGIRKIYFPIITKSK